MDGLGHSKLAPSSADRWGPCPGSVPLIESLSALGQLVPENPADTADGNAAHWLAAETLIHGTAPDVTHDPAGTLLTDEIQEGAAMFVEACLLRAIFTGRQHMHVESSMPIHGVHQLAHGTPDCWVWNEQARILSVLDFKFGYRWVELTTAQLVMYAVGALALMGVDRRNCAGITLEFVIVQPHSYRSEGPVRSFRMPAEDLWPRVDYLRASAIRSQSASPECQTGEWCRDCPARVGCGTYNRALSDCLERITALEVDVLSAEDMGRQYAMLERMEGLLKARKSGLKGTIEAMIDSGKIVPGWMFDSVPGRLTWNPDVDVSKIRATGQLYRKATTKEQPITPTQAIAAGIPEAVVNKMATRPVGRVLTNKSQLSQRAAQEFGK